MTDDALRSAGLHDGAQRPQGSTSNTNATPSPNPRSCVTCRRRKVKCDKQQPCSNCTRAKIDCLFPGPGRAPRRTKKPREDAELLERLRKLEGVVQSLNAQAEIHEQQAAERGRTGSDGCPSAASGVGVGEGTRMAADNSVDGLETRFGRLVVDQGRSRYINNSFWASLNHEVEDLKSILVDASDDEDDTHDSPESNSAAQHQGFIFGYSSVSVDMLSLHPPPHAARRLWETYKENVDPLIKSVHMPSFEPTVLDAFTHPEKVSKGLECFMFTIYYGAITSLTDEECETQWGERRASLLDRYRFGLEQGLARANFLYCDEILVLQAFVVFLIMLRRNDDARKIWTLTGIAVRIAQSLGMHRDGTHFNLPPFEVEMRRRLWWQVCILDARSSEDHGCDPTIIETQFDTKMPLNVNDSDLQPDMKNFPEERIGFTDITFSLIRFEVSNIFRRLLYMPTGPSPCTERFANLTIAEKEKWISDCHQRLEEKYLSNSDMSVPLYWVTATISRLVMSKMWLMIYHPHQRHDGGASLPPEIRDKLFITSLENIEYGILLETEARTLKWGWLFRTHIQWHAIAFLLSELCVRTRGDAVDRAWKALESSSSRWSFPTRESGDRKGEQGHLWKPLKKLMEKARAARARELMLEQASRALHGGFAGPDFPSVLEQAGGSSASNQPSPETLDRMLRPAAPALGDMPIAQPPSWAGSPAATNASAQAPAIDPSAMTVASHFQTISNLGLDHVIGDVMQDIAFDGTSIYESHNASNTDAFPTQHMDMRDLNGLNGASYSLNGNSQHTVTFGDSNGAPDGLHPTGHNSSPSNFDPGASINWAQWDDMVRHFGLDGLPTGASSNSGPGGVVNWF